MGILTVSFRMRAYAKQVLKARNIGDVLGRRPATPRFALGASGRATATSIMLGLRGGAPVLCGAPRPDMWVRAILAGFAFSLREELARGKTTLGPRKRSRLTGVLDSP
jgi:hypothetical protein